MNDEELVMIMQIESLSLDELTRFVKTLEDPNFIRTIYFQKRKYTRIKKAISKNQNTPLDILNLLVDEKNLEIRLALAKHKNSSYEILEKLLDDDDFFVKKKRWHCLKLMRRF